jgi:hypothetical protein
MRLAMAFLLLASSLLACGGEERPAGTDAAAPRAEAARPPAPAGPAPDAAAADDDLEFLGDEGNEADEGDEY